VFRRSAALAIPLVLALGVAACGDGADSLLPEDVAAEVNGEEIPADVLDGIVTAVSAPPAEGSEAPDAPETVELERSVLSSLIQSVIATDLAADEGIELSDDEIAALRDENAEQVAAETEQFGMSDEDYLTYVLLPNALVQELYVEAGDDVPDEEIQAAYDELEATGQTEVATISHILVDTEVEAVDAITRIAGGESFEEVAADVSTDPGSAANGGALGADVPLATFVEPFAEAARTAEIGEVTDPVETEFGFHVLRVDSLTVQSYEDLEPQLRQQAAQGTAQDLLSTAFAEADVIVPARIGVWDGEIGGVVAEEAVGEAPDAPAGTDATAPAQSTEDTSDQ